MNETLKSPQEIESSLNKLIRGEISAEETYRKAIESNSLNKEAIDLELLRRLKADHQQALTELRSEAIRRGIDPDTASGAWGAFANAVTATSKLFGRDAILKTLKEGEEHGLKEYKEVLEDTKLPMNVHSICEKLEAKQREHIALLNQVMEAA